MFKGDTHNREGYNTVHPGADHAFLSDGNAASQELEPLFDQSGKEKHVDQIPDGPRHGSAGHIIERFLGTLRIILDRLDPPGKIEKCPGAGNYDECETSIESTVERTTLITAAITRQINPGFVPNGESRLERSTR